MKHVNSLRVCASVTAVLALGACASTSPPASATSALHPQPLARETVEAIKTNALLEGNIDWNATLRRIESAEPAMSPVEAVRAVLAAYGDPHAKYQTADEARAWQSGRAQPATAGDAQNSSNRAVSAAESAPRIPDGPWGNMLDAQTGYIGLPPCGTGDPKGLWLYAETCRGLVVSMAAAGATRWVIDFRLNGGGNIWPMLVGLQPLLGDGVQFRSIMPKGIEQKFGLTGSVGWIDHGSGTVVNFEIAHAESPSRDVRRDRVAVLTGPWTMSSGEMMTVAFLSRGDVRTFGEPTAGLTTITGFFPLSDGSVLVLPTGRVATASGRGFAGRIEPDERVALGDWPQQDDELVKAAHEWLMR